MRRVRWIFLVPVALLAACLAASFWIRDVGPEIGHGLSEGELLESSRERSGIPENWASVEALTESAYAVLFYDPQDSSDCRFCLWAAREGEQGYFYRGGGNLSAVRDQVGVYPLRNTEYQAVISANIPQVENIQVGDGTDFALDPDQPFALLLPRNPGNLAFTDIRGEEVPYSGHEW